MFRAQTPWLQTLSCKIYAQLLQLYPQSYRQKYAVDMARTFGDNCRFALQESGLAGLFRLWGPTLFDLGLTAIDKHLDEGAFSSRLNTIRVVGITMMTVSAPIFLTAWDASDWRLLMATLLFIAGALVVIITLPGTEQIIKGRLMMSQTVVQSPVEPQQGRTRSYIWAIAALIGLAIFDLIDVMLDVVANMDYVQRMIELYGPVVAWAIGAIPRIIFYLVALWLYRKQSAWALLFAFVLAAARRIFGDGILTRVQSPPGLTIPEYVSLIAWLFVPLVFVTGLWFVIELYRAKQQA